MTTLTVPAGFAHSTLDRFYHDAMRHAVRVRMLAADWCSARPGRQPIGVTWLRAMASSHAIFLVCWACAYRGLMLDEISTADFASLTGDLHPVDASLAPPCTDIPADLAGVNAEGQALLERAERLQMVIFDHSGL